MNNPLSIVFAALLIFIVGIMISREFEPKMARTQLSRNNWPSMNEKGFIGENTGKWSNGDVLFGFNISRVFNIGKRH